MIWCVCGVVIRSGLVCCTGLSYTAYCNVYDTVNSALVHLAVSSVCSLLYFVLLCCYYAATITTTTAASTAS
jgi:archaellum component FlaF (FlaF/FlaG flagellin family)